MKPIIILGSARSGTKLFRSVLSTHPSVMEVPYDISFGWKPASLSHLSHDEFDLVDVDDASILQVRKRLTKFFESKARPGQSIFVEKSVPNSLRPEFVKKVFPDAQIICVFRNGFAAAESAARVWNLSADMSYLWKKSKYCLGLKNKPGVHYLKSWFGKRFLKSEAVSTWGPVYMGMTQELAKRDLQYVAARQWAECSGRLVKFCAENPDVKIMRFEDFITDKSHLVDFLNVNNIPVDQSQLNKIYTNMAVDNIDKWKSKNNFMDDARAIISELNLKLGYNDEK